ncbi:MAG: TspO/MBR family protein [Paracoccus sp. (in: a-proteobacteria)]|uniref:TspO/MBR family protein n=1 Tax=Paracoccus sp. TaxID=267 RepID=UPI00391A36B5
MTNRALAIAVLIAAIAFALSPVIFPGFAGYRPDLFPIPQENPPVQPAGWAFSIWGVIYAWLIAGAAFGLWKRAGGDDWRMMRQYLLASLAVGFFWIPVANRLPGLATLMILAMLAGAVLAMLWAGRRDVWWQVRPVALYAGWLTAASGVSIGVWLGGHGWLAPQTAAVLCLIGVAVAALTMQSMRPREWAYPAAVIWALLGVIAENGTANWLVTAIAAGSAAALLGRIWTARRRV